MSFQWCNAELRSDHRSALVRYFRYRSITSGGIISPTIRKFSK
jgi:hypothetical protein